MPREQTKRIQFLGIAGGVFLFFGILTALLVSYDVYYFVPTHVALGTFLLVSFVLRGGAQVFRGQAAKRMAGFGVGVTVYTVLFLGVLVAINYFAARHEFFHYDSTEEKVYTLSKQTQELLEGLEKPVVFRAFFMQGGIDTDIEKLLSRMSRVSGNVRFQIIDPEKKPVLVERFGISELGTVHLMYGEGSEAREGKVIRDVDEETLVNALLKLVRGAAKTVYVLQGHGEGDIEDNTEKGFLFLQEAMRGENLRVAPLMLQGGRPVPEDASALLVIAPNREMLFSELTVLREYLGGGGNVLFLHEARNVSDIPKIVEPLGIEIGNDVIVDQVVRLFAGPGLGVQPMVNTYGAHPITHGFKEAVVFEVASSVRAEKIKSQSGTLAELAFTSEESWAERDVEKIFSDIPEATFDERDLKGPVSVAVAFEGQIGSHAERGSQGSRMVVVGDADFVNNANIRQLYNRDFFLNALSWVVGEEQGVTIRPRNLRVSQEALTNEQFSTIFLLCVILLPEVVLLFGFSVWWFRR